MNTTNFFLYFKDGDMVRKFPLWKDQVGGLLMPMAGDLVVVDRWTVQVSNTVWNLAKDGELDVHVWGDVIPSQELQGL